MKHKNCLHRALLVLTVVFSAHFASAKSRLFSLYRTNYYTEKTMVYDLKHDQDCNIPSTSAFDVYFVQTKNGQRLSDFSKQNRDYFFPTQIVKESASTLRFKFKALDEMGQKMNKSLALRVSIVKTGQKCRTQLDLVSGQSLVFSNLIRFEVEFILKEYLAFGKQPSGLSWVAVFSPKNQVCLLGSCQ